MNTLSIKDTLAAAALAVVTLVLPGCTFNTSGLAPGPTYACPGKIFRYRQSLPLPPPTNAVVDHIGNSLNAWAPLAPSKAFYPDRGWVLDGTIPPELKGSFVLRIPYSWRGSTVSNRGSDWLLRLALWGRSVDKVWIAFDERASRAPDWLPMDFQKVGPPTYIVSSQHFFDQGGYPPVRYQVWKPKAGFPDYISSTRTVGGNNGPGTVWNSGKTGSHYLLIVRMRPSPLFASKLDSLGSTSFKVGSPGGGGIPQTWFDSAKEEAMTKWLLKPGHQKHSQAYADGLIGNDAHVWACVNIEKPVGSVTNALLVPHDGADPVLLGSWVESSQGEIDPAVSTATVTVSGHVPASTHLQGAIDFTIEDGNTAFIDNVDIWGHDLTLGDGTKISDLTVSQLQGFTAFCADGMPHAPQRLCSRYEVPTDPDAGFSAGAALKVEGHDLTLTLHNSQPLVLDVDLNAMRFTFSGGPLTGNFEINGVTYSADISLSIGGAFTNLAPVANVAETQMEWECGDTGIANVFLSATASTDELDPSDISGFDWFEDRGALTQNHLGGGSTLSVPMAFGSHDLTLKVSDAHGSFSTTDFIIDVIDSKIDSIQLPMDRWVRAGDPSGTLVEIGTASASDICSGHVDIANDAPASNNFLTGFTPVTWTFDDLRGNLVGHTQRIFVLDQAFFPPPISEMELSSPGIVQGQSLVITHHAWPQGRGMFLDEYIIIRDQTGTVWSIDSGGQVTPGINPHATMVNLGVAPTSSTIYSGIIDPFLAGPGVYTVEAVLVITGADPENRDHIVGWSQARFEIVAP